MLAAAFALWAFWPRQFRTLDQTRKYLTTPTEATQLALVRTLHEQESRADRVGRIKVLRLRAALVTLATAVLMLGIGVITTGAGRQ